jgi:hypothetical protein
MAVYWHNRASLPPVGNTLPQYTEQSLTPLLELI